MPNTRELTTQQEFEQVTARFRQPITMSDLLGWEPLESSPKVVITHSARRLESIDKEQTALDRMKKNGASEGFRRVQLREWLLRDFPPFSALEII
jgi:hypothetical protein